MPTRLHRLLRPRSVAVVGASERAGSYGGEALLNLRRVGFAGAVYAVNPRRTSVHGLPCHASLAALPEAVDAVVVAIPAPAAPEVIEEAGRLGCGGAVVFAAGFAEAGGARLEAQLVAGAKRHGLPVCGPNGNGIVCLPERVALWGDVLAPRAPGPVALVSQSGNVAVNALGSRRGLRLHTVVSCGNAAVLDPADFVEALAGQDGVRSLALYLEDDGDGERWCTALEACARAGVAVAVLKAGASAAGAAAAEAHTGALVGDQRVFRALCEEAGAAWARDPHELLELAKALAVAPARGRGRRLAVMTCSGGDSSVAADVADDLGVVLPALAPRTVERLRAILPAAAVPANPLDYTALLWDQPEALGGLVQGLAEDPEVDAVLVFYDDVFGAAAASAHGDRPAGWGAVLEAVRDAAARTDAPVALASTLPELLVDDVAAALVAEGTPAIAGLSTAVGVMSALGAPPPDARRLRELAAAARPAAARGGPGGWLAEHETKALLRAAGVPVPDGFVVHDADSAAAAFGELGPPAVMKLSGAALRHKSELGAIALDLRSEAEVRRAYARLAGAPQATGAAVLVEAMAPPGVEVLVAARTQGVVPTLVLALGGIWTEALGDAVLVGLPASPARVLRALATLRGAPLLHGARGTPAVDLDALARVAADAGELLLDAGLALLELNPVVVLDDRALVLDALARRGGVAPAPEPHPPALQEAP